MILPEHPDQAAEFVWWTSLVLGLVVSLVVALLLWMIHREAVVVQRRVAKIWELGQRVANNTIHIPILYPINRVAEDILQTALRIAEGACGIESHVRDCPGCPHCLMEP